MNPTIKCFAKDDQLVTRRISDETIIVPIRGKVGDMDSIYTLNEVGSAIWNLMDSRTNVEEIVDAICDQYEVTREEAEQDIFEFLDTLEAEGLIRAI